MEIIKQEIRNQNLATELYDIERNVDLFTARAKEIRELLLHSLQDQGVRRVDMQNGNSYIVYPKNKLVIKNEVSAKKWALENPEARMKLDTSKATALALTGKIKWAKVEKNEYLRIGRTRTKTEVDSAEEEEQ